MGKKAGKPVANCVAPPPSPESRRSAIPCFVSFLAGAGLVLSIILFGWGMKPSPAPLPNRPTKLSELLGLDQNGLCGCDIALLNLACAEGCPGSENVKMAACLKTLDEWASKVAAVTERRLPEFQAKPDEYGSSEGQFRMHVLASVVREDLGVRLDVENPRSPTAARPTDRFISGIFSDEKRGTPASMPVLYVALARRLKYPVHLALPEGRILVRWQGAEGQDRFNLDCSGAGLKFLGDEDLAKSTPATRMIPRPLTSAEEFAVFLSWRGQWLEKAGRLREAQLAYAHAHFLTPQSGDFLGALARTVEMEVQPSRLADPRSPQKAGLPDPMEELRRIEAMNAQYRRGVGFGPGVEQVRPQVPSPFGITPGDNAGAPVRAGP
jgi:hypothetical protein